MIEAFNDYLSRINEISSTGKAREESYYTALETLLIKTWKLSRKKEPTIIILPKQTEAGNPDFVIRGSGLRPVGYIEAKAPSISLNGLETSPQIKRYLDVFPNFILTNFLEFRFFRFGRLANDVSLSSNGSHSTAAQDSTAGFPAAQQCLTLLKRFFSFSFPETPNARELAHALAVRTRFFRDMVVVTELDTAIKNNSRNCHILGFYNAFKTYLIHGLSKEEFADLYSQTLTFGLFTAATRRKVKLSRENAIKFIPQTHGLLHDIFQFISIGDIPVQLACSMDDIVDILNSVDTSKLLNEYFQHNKGDDPILHFYETFLTQYDPYLREKRGVYYTPLSIVVFIVQSVHSILKDKFQKSDGLAEKGIRILDPAAGTATFLAECARVAINEYVERYGEGAKLDFAHQFLLHSLYGFEELMAPYAVGHLKMSYILENLGIRLSGPERFNLFLTNSLEMDDIELSNLPGMSTLSKESMLSDSVKKDVPVAVVIGNPPYSGHSLNDSVAYVTRTTKAKKTKRVKVKTWIGELIESYKTIDGIPLKEKNLKWLQDDYVKFIRFAQEKIDENGSGVTAFITNHAYLDNPTFRGMRHSLMCSFDEIYILDLHGNVSKKEKCPDGSKDGNVFDIRQGVAVAFFIKYTKGSHDPGECRVFHADLWGKRLYKYEYLARNRFDDLEWTPVNPWWDFYLFKPVSGKLKDLAFRYRSYIRLTDIFPVHSVGIVTARDELTIKRTPAEINQMIPRFAHMEESKARSHFQLGTDSRDWQLKNAQKDLIASGLDPGKVVPILYRPFDTRYTYYTGKSRGFHCMPRPEVMKHMLRDNLALISVRQVAEGNFSHAFIADTLVESRITTSNKGIGYVFPLYLYSVTEINGSASGGLFRDLDLHSRVTPNINPKLMDLLSRNSSFSPVPSPEHILFYIYAILFSNRYRQKYNEFLRFDFPRIPFTGDFHTFQKMCQLGERLVEFHRLASPQLNVTEFRFEVSGSNMVEKIRFVTASVPSPPSGGGDAGAESSPPPGEVFINDSQFFSNIPEEVWGYHLNGYQILPKWLKLRKNRSLSHEDIRHFIKITRAVQLTIRCQKEIDELFPEVEQSVLGL
jgi:predicted helicase